MSFMKDDSLLSNIKNISIRIQPRINDGSNIFHSIFEISLPTRQMKQQSIIDYDSGIYSIENQTNKSNSFIDKLNISKQKDNLNLPTYHYNWIICKNSGGGVSEDENQQQNQGENHFYGEKRQYDYKMQNDRNQQGEEEKINLIRSEIKQKSFAIQQQQQQIKYENLIEVKKIKNQTKNIPKNYGKAIICFIERYRDKVERITQKCNINYNELRHDLKKIKRSINTIADLRELWSNYKYSRCMRIISYEFFRKHALSYIFDSRICTYSSHIKYRQRLTEAVSSPNQFKHIKDY